MAKDLRTPIAHDPLVPFAVVAGNGRILAKFADEAAAVQFAELSGGLPLDTTPLLPPKAPGWYQSGREPIGKPFASNQPLHLDEVGDWYRATPDGIVKLELAAVLRLMPLQPIGVAE